MARLVVTRPQVLAYRRSVQALNERLPLGPRALRQAAWAGLQDSMPRAALFSIHARVEGATPTTWEARSLVQLWGPRYSVFVVAERDAAIFTLGRWPDDEPSRRRSADLAARLARQLGGQTMTHVQAERALGERSNRLRYATLTGTVRMRWDGARQPTLWTVPTPAIGPDQARLELARRYLHVFGPTTAEAFAGWAGISLQAATGAFQALRRSLTPVRTPIGEAWILTGDAPALAAPPKVTAPARLLPSGDVFFLLQGADRAFLVPDATDRARLWTSRVWPGAVLVDGDLAGTWRRNQGTVSIEPWRRLSRRRGWPSKRRWSHCRCPGPSTPTGPPNGAWRRRPCRFRSWRPSNWQTSCRRRSSSAL
jgi:hypothetical protein